MIWLLLGAVQAGIGAGGHAGVLLATGAATAAWCPVSLIWHPYTTCRWCQSRPGRNAGSTAAVFGRCRMCRGQKVTRPGARVVNRAVGRKI